MREQSGAGLPRLVLIVALSLAVLLAAGVATLGVLSGRTGSNARPEQGGATTARGDRSGPLALPPVKAPEANSDECGTVLAKLPDELRVDGSAVPRRELAAPKPAGTVAWGDAEHDPISLRCGLTAPAELKPTSKLMVVSGVSWLPISSGETTTWLAVDRPVYVAITGPNDTGIGPVQDVSLILRKELPRREVSG
ncbi:DUF3515 domain-containing protein [Actinopolyspora xinjiangensis]|uniref:DUF3515 domain-containing protein n=1 Tax=Actinopolyspora xinjiangensis TaxID=405564 RepID=UPI001FCD1A68|nr:DUF3515 domain-containing protein [Actinopolyspora xinjiangensis]